MNPSVTHFKPKLLSTWKPYFLYLSTSFQRKWGMNVAVFTQGNISIKPKSLRGQRSQVKKIWGYTGLNMRESDKWYVTCYSVRSGSMSCLCMSSCCSTFVILFCWCSNLSQSVQLCGWMDVASQNWHWRKSFKNIICGVWKQYWTIWVVLQRPKGKIFFGGCKSFKVSTCPMGWVHNAC